MSQLSQMTEYVLTFDDIEDFNEALALVFIASSVEHPTDGDYGIHMRNLCNAVSTKLCRIRNRLAPQGVEVPR